MILGHHAGEELFVLAAAGSAGAGSVFVAVARARIAEFLRKLRRR
jgi:hypothetical protein